MSNTIIVPAPNTVSDAVAGQREASVDIRNRTYMVDKRNFSETVEPYHKATGDTIFSISDWGLTESPFIYKYNWGATNETPFAIDWGVI